MFPAASRRAFLAMLGTSLIVPQIPLLPRVPSTLRPTGHRPALFLYNGGCEETLITLGSADIEPVVPSWRTHLLRSEPDWCAFLRRPEALWTESERRTLSQNWDVDPGQVDQPMDEWTYLHWVWDAQDSPAAKAYSFLEEAGIEKLLRDPQRAGDEAGLQFVQGPRPGCNERFVNLWGENGSAKLRDALLRLGHDCDIIDAG